MNNIYEGNHPLRKILRCSILEWNLLCHVTYLSNEITNGWCIKSIASLSSYLDLDQSTIRRNLIQLRDKGFIVYETSNHGSRSKPTPIVWEIIAADHVDVVIYKDGEPILGAFLNDNAQKLPVMQNVKALSQNVKALSQNANAVLVKCQSGVDILPNISKDINIELSKESISCNLQNESIAKSDTGTTSSLGEQKDQAVEDSIIQSNVRKKTLEPRGAGRGAAEISEDGQRFAKWFSTKTQMKRFKASDLKSWGETYDKLIKIGYTKLEVAKMCEWALSDDFWKSNFLSANKLVSKNKEKVPYHEYFMAKVREVEPPKTTYNAKPYNPTGAHLQ